MYIPIYEEKFASELLKALTGSFKQEDGRIGVYDDNNVKQYEIIMPSVSTDDLILAGTGTVRAVAIPGQTKNYSLKRIHLNDDDERGRGLFSLLQPLYRDPSNINVKDIKKFPFLHPDVIRIAVTRLGEAGIPGADVSFSDRAYELTFNPDSPGLPLALELANPSDTTHGFILSHPYEGRIKKAIYLEKYSGYNVGDLRALGWVLWSFFTGAAEYQDGMIRDSNLTPLLSRDISPGRPFDAANDMGAALLERPKIIERGGEY